MAYREGTPERVVCAQINTPKHNAILVLILTMTSSSCVQYYALTIITRMLRITADNSTPTSKQIFAEFYLI